MKISEPKIKRMILFFATYTDPKLLGKTKLMKLFYFTDFRHVKKYLTPVTYDTYVNLEHGPVPSTIMNLVTTVENEIDNSILGDVVAIAQNDESKRKRIVARRKFNEERDSKYFTKSELAVMNEVCEIFKNSTGKQIEDASHSEAAWLNTKFGETIPYSLAANDPDSSVEKDDVEKAIRLTQ
ncbi:MAG: SocA family protein [Candidatus Brennerbacteria bacterium]|nr:SocA family protein [Candidatus Brennerbacteria bacterium]